MQREGEEENGPGRAEEFSNLVLGVIEVAAAVESGIADQENAHERRAIVTDVTTGYMCWKRRREKKLLRQMAPRNSPSQIPW
jgi:hypothetical protein